MRPAESMTGFAAVEAVIDGQTTRFEIRSVNHRGLVWKGRLPQESELESLVDEALRRKFRRGSFQIFLHRGEGESSGSLRLAAEALEAWVVRCRSEAARLRLDEPRDLLPFLGLPGVLVEGGAPLSPEARKEIEALVERGLEALLRVRRREGEGLLAELRGLCGKAQAWLAAYEEALPEALAAARERLKRRVETVLRDCGWSGGGEDLPPMTARELALLAERFEVAEEIARLRLHLEEVGRRLEEGGALGRPLEFLAQEMLREANTLGSKTQDAKLAHVVVELRTCLERIREQAQNLA